MGAVVRPARNSLHLTHSLRGGAIMWSTSGKARADGEGDRARFLGFVLTSASRMVGSTQQIREYECFRSLPHPSIISALGLIERGVC